MVMQNILEIEEEEYTRLADCVDLLLKENKFLLKENKLINKELEKMAMRITKQEMLCLR